MIAKKSLPSSDIKDFIPVAFQDDCSQPYSIQINYEELPDEELEFSYTLKWRSTKLPAKMEQVGEVQSRLVKKEKKRKVKKKTAVKKTVKAPTKEKTKSSKTQDSMDRTQKCLSAPVKSPADIVTEPLHRLKSALMKKFNCPRYIYSSSSSRSSQSMSNSVISVPKGPSPAESPHNYSDWAKKKSSSSCKSGRDEHKKKRLGKTK